ncbi:hypothetical protein IPH25_00345 [bacterium]|nr:MAG: hypothetical protein IPH25_00345 [bacterium]
MVRISVFIIFALFQTIFLHAVEPLKNIALRRITTDLISSQTSYANKIQTHYGLHFETGLESEVIALRSWLNREKITNKTIESYKSLKKRLTDFKPEDAAYEFEQYAHDRFFRVKKDIEISCKISFGQWSCDETLPSETLYRKMSKELITIFNYVVEMEEVLMPCSSTVLNFGLYRFCRHESFYEKFGFFAFDTQKPFKDILLWFSDNNNIANLKRSLIQFSFACAFYVFSEPLQEALDEVNLLKKEIKGFTFMSRLASMIEYVNSVNKSLGYEQRYEILPSLSTLDQFRLLYFYCMAAKGNDFGLPGNPSQEIVINDHKIDVFKWNLKQFKNWMEINALIRSPDETITNQPKHKPTDSSFRAAYFENDTYQTEYYANLHHHSEKIVNELNSEEKKYLELKKAFNTMQILFPEIDDQAYARSILTALKHLFKEDLIVQVTGHQEHNLHNCFNPTPSKIKEFYSTLKSIQNALSQTDAFNNMLTDQYQLNQTMKTFFGDDIKGYIKADHFIGVMFLRRKLISFLYSFHSKNYTGKDCENEIASLPAPYNKEQFNKVKVALEDCKIFKEFFEKLLTFLDWLKVSQEAKTRYLTWHAILKNPKANCLTIDGLANIKEFLYESFDQIIEWCTLTSEKTDSSKTFQPVIQTAKKEINELFENHNTPLIENAKEELLEFHIEISAKECERYLEKLASFDGDYGRSVAEKNALKEEGEERKARENALRLKWQYEQDVSCLDEIQQIRKQKEQTAINLAREDRTRQISKTVEIEAETNSTPNTVNPDNDPIAPIEKKNQNIQPSDKRFVFLFNLLKNSISAVPPLYFYALTSLFAVCLFYFNQQFEQISLNVIHSIFQNSLKSQ